MSSPQRGPDPDHERVREESSQETLGSGQNEEAAAAAGKGDSPPDGGYGWVCVVCVALINMHTWGLNSSYGIFLAYFTNNNTFPGATLVDFAFVGGLSISVAMLLAPLVTLFIRKTGTRVTLIIGVLFEALALITASFATKIWHLFLSQGVCFGIGLGFLYVATVGIVPQWFGKKRSFANACGAAGSGLGGLVYNLAAQKIIDELGFGWAYRIIGIVSFAVNMTCAILVRDRNKEIGANFKLFNWQLFKRPAFDLVQAWGWFSMFGYLVLIYSLPDYATSIGLTPYQGSIIGALLNLGQFMGRPFVGIFSDRVGRINIAGFLSILCGIFCLAWWIPAKSFGALASFAIVTGTVAGTYWATIAPVGAEVIGLKDLPSALSMTWLVLVLPVTFSEPIALEIESNTGYVNAQIWTGIMYLAAGVCLWFVRAWKIGQLEVQTQVDEKAGTEGPARPKSNFLKRMVMWKRV